VVGWIGGLIWLVPRPPGLRATYVPVSAGHYCSRCGALAPAAHISARAAAERSKLAVFSRSNNRCDTMPPVNPPFRAPLATFNATRPPRPMGKSSPNGRLLKPTHDFYRAQVRRVGRGRFSRYRQLVSEILAGSQYALFVCLRWPGSAAEVSRKSALKY